MQQAVFSPAGGTTTTVPSLISSRPPEGASGGSFEHEPAGDEGERGGSAGNRWPRQETLALLKIRSEMDAAFREAALKGPLWEEVSRKLAAMGYKRSAKKCREKFENVDKYYKRTKDGRAGRGDGKAYRFFSELEALHGGAGAGASSLAPTPVAMAPPVAALFPPPPPPPAVVMHAHHEPPAAVAVTASIATPTAAVGDVSFSSSSDDGEDTDETGGDGGKRKRRGGGEGGGGSSSKMMRFFEGLMRQVMERQEEMQQRFIEAIERREQDRMIREEAWRRQEVARLAREQDALAQERAMAASRDAAVVSFIQRITGQTIPMPPASVVSFKPTPVVASAAQPPSIQPKPALAPAPAHPPATMMPTAQSSQQPATTGGGGETTNKPEVTMVRAPPPVEQQQQQQQVDMAGGGAPSPSRWPKAEVHALIQLRTELEARYQDAGPKGPLWEDISAGMRRMGYNRSAKRCKEKWENINKYFKKVKESNKKRPEDSKTCPYYHQLDALYRNKQHQALIASPPSVTTTVLAAVPLSSQTPPHHQSLPTDRAAAANNNNNKDCSSIGNGNGCAATGTRDSSSLDNGMHQGSNGTAATNNKHLEDMIMTKETPTPEEMPQPVSMNDSYVNDRMDAGDSDDSMDDDEDDFDDDDEDDVNNNNTSKAAMHQYEIQFQRQHQQSQSSVVRPNAAAGAGSGPGPAATSGSFLTMVHH